MTKESGHLFQTILPFKDFSLNKTKKEKVELSVLGDWEVGHEVL